MVMLWKQKSKTVKNRGNGKKREESHKHACTDAHTNLQIYRKRGVMRVSKAQLYGGLMVYNDAMVTSPLCTLIIPQSFASFDVASEPKS